MTGAGVGTPPSAQPSPPGFGPSAQSAARRAVRSTSSAARRPQHADGGASLAARRWRQVVGGASSRHVGGGPASCCYQIGACIGRRPDHAFRLALIAWTMIPVALAASGPANTPGIMMRAGRASRNSDLAVVRYRRQSDNEQEAGPPPTCRDDAPPTTCRQRRAANDAPPSACCGRRAADDVLRTARRAADSRGPEPGGWAVRRAGCQRQGPARSEHQPQKCKSRPAGQGVRHDRGGFAPPPWPNPPRS